MNEDDVAAAGASVLQLEQQYAELTQLWDAARGRALSPPRPTRSRSGSRSVSPVLTPRPLIVKSLELICVSSATPFRTKPVTDPGTQRSCSAASAPRSFYRRPSLGSAWTPAPPASSDGATLTGSSPRIPPAISPRPPSTSEGRSRPSLARPHPPSDHTALPPMRQLRDAPRAAHSRVSSGVLPSPETSVVGGFQSSAVSAVSPSLSVAAPVVSPPSRSSKPNAVGSAAAPSGEGLRTPSRRSGSSSRFKRCRNCGNGEVRLEANFCQNCGMRYSDHSLGQSKLRAV